MRASCREDRSHEARIQPTERQAAKSAAERRVAAAVGRGDKVSRAAMTTAQRQAMQTAVERRAAKGEEKRTARAQQVAERKAV
jgi:hypothetical protein